MVAVWSLALAYVGALLWRPALGPGDDYTFLRTIQSGRWFPVWYRGRGVYDVTRLGRFTPLSGYEYNIIASFSRTPFAYYSLNALQLIVFLAAMQRVASPLALLVILLSPGFVLAWFRLHWSERNVALAIAVLLATRHTPYAWVSALPIAFSVYSKEPAFLGFLVYGLLASDWYVVACAATYPILYAILVMPHRMRFYASSLYAWPLVAVKNVANYAFFSDPVVMLIGMPLAILHPTATALAGCAYLAVYLAMNVYTPYYLLPALVWMAPDLSTAHVAPWQAAVVGLILLVNAVPAALHYLTMNKHLPRNFHLVLDYLAGHPPARLFLYGVERSNHSTSFLIWHEFLLWRLRRDVAVSSVEPQRHPDGPDAADSSYMPQAIEPQAGDVMIVGPDSLRPYAGPPDGWQIVHAVRARCSIPFWTAKTALKGLLARRWNLHRQRYDGWLVNGNLAELPDYLVLEKS